MDFEIPAAIAAERQRQIDAEGYSTRHDDEHDNGELLVAATMYYQRAIGVALPMRHSASADKLVPVGWPWDAAHWKPKTARRDLERAGALCLAERERLGRRGHSLGPVTERLGLIVAAYRSLPL